MNARKKVVTKPSKKKLSVWDKIKIDYQKIKEYRRLRRQWRKDFEALKHKDIQLTKDQKKLADDIKNHLKNEEWLKKRVDDFNNKNLLQNFTYNNAFEKFMFWLNPRGVIIFILLRKDRSLYIGYKKVMEGKYVIHEDLNYYIKSEFFQRSGSYFVGHWLEDKLEQLNPSYLDKSPISTTNFKNIFNQKLINMVFNPKDEKNDFKWIIWAVGGVVLILLILHFTGVIDLVEIGKQIGGYFQGGAQATNSTATPSQPNPRFA